MTPDEMAQAIVDAGLGWSPDGGLTTAAAAGSSRCNTIGCDSFAAIANEAGLTADQIMPALVAEAGDPLADPPVAPDPTALRAHSATKKQFRLALAARDLSWSVGGGLINVWNTSDRGSEVQPHWLGVAVTSQAYRAQSAIAGASDAEMAEALSALVGDPTADPPVAPDASMFDAIMGA